MPASKPSSHTVLITGASSGIGRSAALRFAARGCRLVLAARGAENLEKVAAECSAAGAADVLARPTDIAERDGVDALFAAAVERFGGVDVVVQNASVAAFGRFSDVPSEIFEAVIRINVLGAANVARAAQHRFREQDGGRLIVVGSLLGHAAVPYMGAYVMSKFAVTALVRMLRQESRETPGITVHGVYPGAVDTSIYPLSANYFGRVAHVLPFNDTPDKVARAIVAAADAERSSERQVGLANWPMIAGYRLLPRVFDALVGPLMRVGSFTREQFEAAPGNALTRVAANSPSD
ncbi:Short-chain dehydrogenase [Mycolicibacterium rutilum]|uniref:Short-chain dehydrogenase n=1 Tax=Mycolicibacterium rutilum TaxID=370526 RepID=A0A1H6IPX3_MYCRU|nr:SDR family oxidoreductase [Mycolicibacterium rutilum]SEH50802.1 Short-chain dehydrogenase [Mycolicibacterium rutilum]